MATMGQRLRQSLSLGRAAGPVSGASHDQLYSELSTRVGDDVRQALIDSGEVQAECAEEQMEATLLRYLRAESWSVNKAHKRLLAHVEWRLQTSPASIPQVGGEWSFPVPPALPNLLGRGFGWSGAAEWGKCKLCGRRPASTYSLTLQQHMCIVHTYSVTRPLARSAFPQQPPGCTACLQEEIQCHLDAGKALLHPGGQKRVPLLVALARKHYPDGNNQQLERWARA